jgi:anti-sigma B factor antagonist
MNIQTRRAGPTVVVARCIGRLDRSAAPALNGVITDSLTRGGANIVADLAGITFIDSSGLGALVAALRQLQHAGWELRIAAASSPVLTVLELTNLDRLLGGYLTVEDAVAEWHVPLASLD